jgi:hypothetical protein
VLIAWIEEPPEARIGEHRLGHDRAADEVRHHEPHDGHEGQERVAQDVPAHHVPFLQALERAVRT